MPRPYFVAGEVVYFIKCRGKAPVKIGYSANIQRRFRELQIAHRGERLVILAVIPGDEQFENILHRILDPWKLPHDGTDGGGEWFKLDGLSEYATVLHSHPDIISNDGSLELILRNALPAMAKTPKNEKPMTELKTYIPTDLYREFTKESRPLTAITIDAVTQYLARKQAQPPTLEDTSQC